MNLKEQDILFSIIIPTYNRSGMIGKAIESVLAQTYSHWELIIIDDGSTDNTREIAKRYNDKRIKYYYQKNKGKSAARNKGIEMSKGDYLAFLDDDDYYLNDFLFSFYKKIKDNNFKKALYMCDVIEEEESGEKIYFSKNMKYIDNPPLFLWINSTNYLPFVTHRDAFQHNIFDIRFPLGQDFHLLIRIAMNMPLYYIPKILCVIYNHKNRSVVRAYKENYNEKINNLNFLEDLIQNHFLELNRFIPSRYIFDKYNKIAYFYGSTALRKRSIKYALKMMKNINWQGTKFKVIYYKLSLLIRSLYYGIF